MSSLWNLPPPDPQRGAVRRSSTESTWTSGSNRNSNSRNSNAAGGIVPHPPGVPVHVHGNVNGNDVRDRSPPRQYSNLKDSSSSTSATTDPYPQQYPQPSTSMILSTSVPIKRTSPSRNKAGSSRSTNARDIDAATAASAAMPSNPFQTRIPNHGWNGNGGTGNRPLPRPRPESSSSTDTAATPAPFQSPPDQEESNNNEMMEAILLNVEARHHQRQQRATSVFDQPSGAGHKRRMAHHPDASLLGKFTGEELDQLSLFATMALDGTADANTGSSTPASSAGSGSSGSGSSSCSCSCSCSWMTMDLDGITTLSGYLDEHVQNAMNVDMIHEARAAFEDSDTKWFDTKSSSDWNLSPGMQRFTILRYGIQAATILLSIMITPNIDRRVVNEDAIENIIALMRKHLGKNVIPTLSGTGHTVPFAINGTTTSSTTNTSNSSQEPPAKKRKKSNSTPKKTTSQQSLIKSLKKIYPFLTSTVGLLTNLMERLDLLIQSVAIEDQPLLSICASALSSLTIDPSSSSSSTMSLTHAIQTSCTNVVTTVFQRYPRHRVVILEDLMPLFLKIPTSKKSIRTFSVRVGGSLAILGASYGTTGRDSTSGSGVEYNIQVITALLLSLIQSCVTMPHSIQNPQDMYQEDSSAVDLQQRKDTRLTSGLLECERTCQIFVTKLIQRCSKKGGEGGASEFRPVLSNLVEDLLLVQMLPEFPSAEMVLMHICRKLCDDLIANSAVGGSNNNRKSAAEATYLTTAMDTIGTICSNVVGKMCLARDNPLVFPKAVDVDAVDAHGDPTRDSSKEVNRCFCGRTNLVDTFMLDCDRCHNWFHGSCVGIAKDNLPNTWICDECTMQLLVLDQMKEFSSSMQGKCIVDERTDNLANEDKVHIMRVLLLNFLSHQVTLTKSSFSKMSRQFHLAKFVKDLEAIRSARTNAQSTGGILVANVDAVCNRFLWLWDSNGADAANMQRRGVDDSLPSSRNRQEYEYLSEEGNAKLMLALNASKSDLVTSFPHLLGVIIALMGDENAGSLRKLAVKALSQIVKVDSSLMSKDQIRDAVAKRFNDEAISVREAAVSLVGFYVLEVPEFAKSFHAPLLLRLNDNGVSVRKRVIKIFRDLIAGHPKYPGRATVFTKLLTQASNRKEDDGVRDLIHDTFISLWFANYKSFGIKSKTSATIVTPNSDNITSIGDTARQMVEVVAVSSSPKHLSYLVQEMINGKGDNAEEKKASQRKVDKVAAGNYCASIVACLIEELLVFEEQRGTIAQDRAGTRLVSLLITLGVFAEASPFLLKNHYDSLLHYLKADNGVSTKCESLVVLNVCKILSHVSTCFNDGDIQRLGRSELSQDLVKITYKFGVNASGAAIETLAKLANHLYSDGSSPLMNALIKLAKVFYSHLHKMKDAGNDFSKMKEKERNNIHRALSVLGCICRHHHQTEAEMFLEDDLKNIVVIIPNELRWEILPSACFALFQKYLGKVDAGTRCKAIRAMAGIFSGNPRILLDFQQKGVLEEVMSDQAHPSLQLESLQCLREILTAEEMRVESGEACRQMESKNGITTSKKISGDQDGDASLIGACCIQNASRIFEMSYSVYPSVRLHALLLIETLSRQGLLNPMEVVPVLFALQGDSKYSQIRALALKLLLEEAEKRPDMIRQLFAEGIRHCYQFQRKINNKDESTSALVVNRGTHGQDQIECIFGPVFQESMRNNRTHTNRVLKSLLALFTGDEENSQPNKLQLLSFTAEVIAYLPYNHLENILFIVHQISGIVSVKGNDVLSRLHLFLCPLGLTTEDSDLGEDDKLEAAATKPNPSRTKALSIMTKPSFDMDGFKILCTEASAITLLLKLSAFLRATFSGVTNSRLSEYLPGEKERLSDRSPLRTNTVPLTSEVYSPQSFSSKGPDLDVLICQYAKFRALMRADANHAFAVDSDGHQLDNSS